jgi:hypothetical protein
MLSGLSVTGCGIAGAVKKVAHDVSANKAIIGQFTSTMKSGEAMTFEATYLTTGASPARIVYAVRPPNGLAFQATMSGSGTGVSNVDIVVNSAGEYSCSPPSASGTGSSGTGSGSAWSCQKLGTASAATRNKILSFYTPAHWVVFLRDFSLAAGFAGDRVTSSSMTVNGFSMRCVDFHAAGVQGTSTICTTAQGILGYVKVASESTSFQLKRYSVSPPASLFELPPGAKITTPKKGTA